VIDEREHALVVVGMRSNKGPQRAMAVLAALPERLRARTRLWLIGPASAGLRLWRFRQALALGIAPLVRQLGALDDVAPLLARADLCLHLSDDEGQPLALLEAMAEGTPVIASDVSGCRELLCASDEDGEGDVGIVVAKDDTAGAATQVARLLEATEERARLGAAAQRRAAQQHDVASTTAAFRDAVIAFARGEHLS